MQLGNSQNNQFMGQSGQIKLSPINNNFPGAVPTYTYGLHPMSINAFNCSSTSSGLCVNSQKWRTQNLANNYASSGQYSQTPNLTYGVYAGQFGHAVSGIDTGGQYSRGMIQPSVNVSETSCDVMVAAYLPNVIPNDVSLNVTSNSVTIIASAWTGNEHLILNRTVALPTSIRAESVDASFLSGVLEIRLPKVDKGMRTRTTITPETV